MLDVVVIGAGASGLACAQELVRSGLQVQVLEGRPRIGGRILTQRDPNWEIPAELGAEFIHGTPPEILNRMKGLSLPFHDVCDTHFEKATGKLSATGKFWDEIESVMKKLKPERKGDRSVEDFVNSLGRSVSPKTKKIFRAFVEGFHSADLHLIGEKGLVSAEQSEEDEFNGVSAFRPSMGYDRLFESFLSDLQAGENLRLGVTVNKISWGRKKKFCQIFSKSATGENFPILHAKKVVVTAPIGVLKAPPGTSAAIDFDPYPKELKEAFGSLQMGHVQRISFRFRARFWEKSFEKPLGYLHAGPESDFPTWWTTNPIRSPILVAWQGGPRALQLSEWPEENRVAIALEALSFLLSCPLSFIQEQLQSWKTHNWSQDPFALGAYSYVAVDGLSRAARLARPFEEHLFFAGEATQLGGKRGTVDGAIATGMRAAQQILKQKRTKEKL